MLPSRIFREPHVYLSRGSHLEIFCQMVRQKKTLSRTQKKIAGSNVGTLAAFVVDNLYSTWTFRSTLHN